MHWGQVRFTILQPNSNPIFTFVGAIPPGLASQSFIRTAHLHRIGMSLGVYSGFAVTGFLKARHPDTRVLSAPSIDGTKRRFAAISWMWSYPIFSRCKSRSTCSPSHSASFIGRAPVFRFSPKQLR